MPAGPATVLPRRIAHTCGGDVLPRPLFTSRRLQHDSRRIGRDAFCKGSQGARVGRWRRVGDDGTRPRDLLDTVRQRPAREDGRAGLDGGLDVRQGRAGPGGKPQGAAAREVAIGAAGPAVSGAVVLHGSLPGDGEGVGGGGVGEGGADDEEEGIGGGVAAGEDAAVGSGEVEEVKRVRVALGADGGVEAQPPRPGGAGVPDGEDEGEVGRRGVALVPWEEEVDLDGCGYPRRRGGGVVGGGS